MQNIRIKDNILSDNNFILDDFNTPAIARNIADKVRQRRLMLNLTQDALSKKSGVSLGTLKRFEHKAEISLKHLLMIAVSLQATEEFFQLFAQQHYQSIDDVVKENKAPKRRRGRKSV